MTKNIFLFICATLLVGIALYTPTTSIFNHNNVYAATKKAKIKFNKTQKKIVKKAREYAKSGHMSKDSIIEKLKKDSKKYRQEDINFVINNLKVDYKKNALISAKIYSKTMNLSKQSIFEQLYSESPDKATHSDKFTKEESQYAIDHLKVDFKENALETAKSYQSSSSLSKEEIYKQLTSTLGDKFTNDEAQYAVDHLK